MLEKIDGPVTEYRASTTEDFWEVLCPQKYLFGPHNKSIFRGQTNAVWQLEPSILRKNNNHHIYSSLVFRSGPEQSEHRIFAEIHALSAFDSYCDSAGLRIPSDSEEFGRVYLHPPATLYPDFYGAAKATLDSLACWSESKWTDGQDIRAQTLPVWIEPPTE